MYLKELIKKIKSERSLSEFYHLKPEILKYLEQKLEQKIPKKEKKEVDE